MTFNSFGYLKSPLELLILFCDLLIIIMRNLQINLRNKVLYLYILIAYMTGFTPCQYLALYTEVRILFKFFKNDLWIIKVF